MAPPSACHADESSTSKYPNSAVRCRGKPRWLRQGGGHRRRVHAWKQTVADIAIFILVVMWAGVVAWLSVAGVLELLLI